VKAVAEMVNARPCRWSSSGRCRCSTSARRRGCTDRDCRQWQWGFSALRDAVAINGDIKAVERVGRYSRQFDLLFDAGNCHDMSRIARLPGTANMPGAKSRWCAEHA